MKKKKILLIVLAVFVALAVAIAYFVPVGLLIHTLRAFTKEDDITEVRMDDTIRFSLNGTHMVIEAEVNGEPDSVIYDTGASFMLLMMYTPTTRPDGMRFYRYRVTGADKKSRIKVTSFPVNISIGGLSEYGVGTATLNPEPDPCAEFHVSKYDILGAESLNIGHCLIDFTKREMCFVSFLEPIDTTGFIPVKCKLEKNVLWVYPRLNGVEYECIFDTGNGSSGFLLKDEQRVENPRESDCIYEGSYGTSIGGHVDKQRFVRAEEKFSLVGDDKEVEACYVNDLPFNNMGLKAISQFDWIVSAMGDGLKMYARPHVSDEVTPFAPNRYKLVASDGKLKILTCLIDGNETFKVGDRIVSVNGEKITEENICHYYDLLTEAKDWSEFDIRVR